MIRAIFFDIDGTLISMKTRHMQASLIDALNRMKDIGIRLFIASGRPPVQLQLLCQEFRDFRWDGFILMNGQYCTDENGNVFHKQPFEKKTLESLIPWLKENADYPCSFYELDYMYDIRFNEGMHNYLSSIGRLDQMPPVEDPVRALNHDTYQICPYIPASMDAEFVSHAPGMVSARWSEHFADMIPEGGGKTEGMRRMLERFSIAREDCMACGDGGNDIGMIEYAGIGVAMGNASEEVRRHADYVTADCEDDGLIKAFAYFGLI